MKIMGVDPGLADTGVGIVHGKNLSVAGYACGQITTDPKTPLAQRLSHIHAEIQSVLKSQNPDLMVLEDAFSLARYPKSGIMLGRVSGVILLAAHQYGIPAIEIPVREAKQVLTGNGAATKSQLESTVRRILNIHKPIRPFHQSDALALSLLGLFRYSSGLTFQSLRIGSIPNASVCG